MLLTYFPILFWAPQSVHYLSRGFWARLCTRAHAWLFRGCNSTGTLRGRRTGFWSSSSLTPEGRWSTKGMGQSKNNSVRTLYAQLHEKKASDISITYRQLRQLSFTSGACFLRLPPVPICLLFFFGHCSGTGASSWASSVKIRWLETFEKYSISDL